jgi:uncharacterized LabA/DUF88 family protein
VEQERLTVPDFDHTYLFIDGGYLRAIYGEGMTKFCGNCGDLDVKRIRYADSASRAYFYDSSDDEQRPGESEPDFLARTVAEEDFFDEIRAVNGFHVRLGSVTGKKRRQKEVDVLLAVDMLTHGLAGNMKKGILLAGDLDFRPIVEALVQRGVFVDIWFERRSAAKNLYGAADFGREIRFSELHSLSSQAVQLKYPLPHRAEGLDRPNGGILVKQGTVRARPALLHALPNNLFEFWIQELGGNSLTLKHKDLTRIESFLELEYGQKVAWDPRGSGQPA